jgi:molybdenum cofactor cytidylyltransferase
VNTPTTCWDALELDAVTPPVVAIVGGGGKTSLLFRLGREARDRGRSAVLTGTTRFTTPPPLSEGIDRIATGSPDAAPPLGALIAAREIAVVHAGTEPKSRWAPLDPTAIDEMAGTPGLGLIAIEADGSKMRPFKAPADHEPVIPASATHVVVAVGMRALDAPLDEANVHRPERVRAIVGDEASVSAEVIARVLIDNRGGRKDVGDRAFSVLINQADLDPTRALALAEAIREAGATRVIVAALQDDESPIRAVLHS